MTVFDALLPILTMTARTHLQRGRQRASRLQAAIIGDYNATEWAAGGVADGE